MPPHNPARLLKCLRILRADLWLIANGARPAPELLEWPPDTREFLHQRIVPVHDHQLPPPDPEDWTTWLVLGGRGAGKTRAGAEWVQGLAAGFSLADAAAGRPHRARRRDLRGGARRHGRGPGRAARRARAL